MPSSLLVRNLDDRLVERLKRRAASKGRSAEAEHRLILQEALGEPEVDREAWFRELNAFRASLAGKTFTPSEVLQRESRDER